MEVLQISKPSGSNIKTLRYQLAAGIDLGTTNSLIATVYNGKAQTLPDDKGRHLLPSVVRYQKNSYSVGYDAFIDAMQDPANTITSVKRMIGRSLIDIQKCCPNLPYRLRANKYGAPVIETRAGLLTPIQVSSDILKTLAIRATEFMQGNLDGVVITVPAYFNYVQRQEIKEAAQIAKLRVLRLLSEPTAAAIAYGLDSGKEGVIAVYDFGGGTFDISILRLSRGVFEVLSTGGDSTLGGDDVDYLLAEYIAKLANISFSEDIHVRREILNTAISAKIKLSEELFVNIHIGNWKGIISRDQLNDLISPLVKRTILACKHALKSANVETTEVLEVVMVGGSTRVPLVRESVRKFFGRTPLTSIDPDKVVAIGAAIQADILIGNKPESDMLLLDIIPLSLGIETIGGLVEKVILRNSSIPVVQSKEFTTFKDGQTLMSIHVIQGERELVKDCCSLARFTLRGIPSLPAGKARVRVIFQVDADGLLNVTAIEKSTCVEASIYVKPTYGLNNKEISSMIQESIRYAEQDAKTRLLTEKKIEDAHIARIKESSTTY